MDDQPAWLINSKQIWQEDDSGAYDRETIREAWPRLFGGERRPSLLNEAIATHDAGDTCYFLFPEGRIYVQSFEGCKIRVAT